MPETNTHDMELKNAIKSLSNTGRELPSPPKDYHPLTTRQKNEWNNFLHYLYTKGIAGDKALDKGTDQTTVLMEQYKSVNPAFDLKPEIVPSIQYEVNLLQHGMIPSETGQPVSVMGTAFGKAIPSTYYGQPVSKIDGRIGSLTSMEAFPTPYSKDLNKSWGTDYWQYLHDMAGYMNKTGSHFVQPKKQQPVTGTINNKVAMVQAMKGLTNK